MYIKKGLVKGNAIAVRIAESYRENGKIRQRIIKHIGQSKDPEEIIMFEQMARSIILKMDNKKLSTKPLKKTEAPDIPLKDLEEIARYNSGVFDIFGSVYDSLGFNHLIEGTKKDDQWNEILRSLVLLRLSDPTSKRESADILSKDYSKKIPLEKIYRTMDCSLNFKSKAKKIIFEKTKELEGGRIGCMLYDVTTLYFESFEENELKEFGFSKDCKFKEVQIVLSLLTSDKGHPIGYMLFPGSTSEGKTLIENLNSLKEEYGLKEIKLFADRAMFTKENLNKMDELGIKYVVAAKLRSMNSEWKKQFTLDNDFSPINFDGDLYWKKEYEYEERRLIVTYSSKRAHNDFCQRERLVERLFKKEKNGKISLKSLINNSGSKRFINVQKDIAVINTEKIKEASLWDGIHGVITNDNEASATDILSGYKRLWMIEECFRIGKTDLKMRPIYHWKKERIEAHILICFISLAIGKFTLQKLSIDISLASLIKELSRVEVSVLRDKTCKTGRLMALPSSLNSLQIKIYEDMGISRKMDPWYL